MTMKQHGPQHSVNSATLADLLERILDKGIVIAGDIRVNLVQVELLTIQIRLVICSVDKAKEIGLDWWRDNPAFSRRIQPQELQATVDQMEERLATVDQMEERLATVTQMEERLATFLRNAAGATGRINRLEERLARMETTAVSSTIPAA